MELSQTERTCIKRKTDIYPRLAAARLDECLFLCYDEKDKTKYEGEVLWKPLKINRKIYVLHCWHM